jgi:hypothetical protein
MRQVQRIGDEAALLCWAARVLEMVSPTARKRQMRALAESFAAELSRRFDPRTEAANLSQTGRHFAHDARLVVPEIIWDLVTQRVDTLAATDIDGRHTYHVNVARLAAHIIEVVAQQAFEHGFFHAALDARHLRVSIEPATLGRLVLADSRQANCCGIYWIRHMPSAAGYLRILPRRTIRWHKPKRSRAGCILASIPGRSRKRHWANSPVRISIIAVGSNAPRTNCLISRTSCRGCRNLRCGA